MSPGLVEQFRSSRPTIRARWEALLRVEPVSGPLANPDALVHLIPHSLEELFAALAKPSRAPGTLKAAKKPLPACDCGNNPYRAYFVAGEQALAESFVLLQATLPPAHRRESDLAEVIYHVRRMAQDEIDTFCGICDQRGKVARCRQMAAV